MSAAVEKKATGKVDKKDTMRVGVVCDDEWHPAEVIQEGMAPLANADTKLEFITDTGQLSREQLRSYDVLVLARNNSWVTEDLEQDICNHVVTGGGLLVLHSGTVGYRNNPEFRALIGGVFIQHPHHCPVTLEYVSDFGKEDSDPETILIHDEHYFMETTEDINIFLRAKSASGTQSAGWTRTEGSGHVCVLTPGHFLEVWHNPIYQHTLRKALDWCAPQTHRKAK